MGKRELLLIAAFVVVGVVVYQVTAPAGESSGSGFSIGRIIDEIRREVRGRPASAEITATATHPLPAGVTELRVTLQNSPVTITGEDRTDIATDLWVRSNGVDEAEAKSLAGKAVLKVEPAGPTVTVSVSLPQEGSQRVRLGLRVPSAMLVQFGPTNARIEVAGVQGVELESARGETIIKQIKGRASITHRGGDFTVEDVGSVRLTTRGSDVRLARISGESTLEIQAGDLRAAELLGPVEIESAAADITLEDLQKSRGPFRVNATGGAITIRGLRAEARIEGRDAEIDVVFDQAAPAAIFNTGDRIQITPPRDGYTLDAVATDGRIIVPDTLAPEIASSATPDDKEHRASGKVNGGGPSITIRATRGDIRVNAREP
jgi:Putative adhesin